MAGMGTFAKKMQSRELGNSFDYTAAESVAMRALYSPPEASFLTAQMLGQGRRTVKNMFSIVFSFNLTKVLSFRIYPELSLCKGSLPIQCRKRFLKRFRNFFSFLKKGFHGANSAVKRHRSRKCRDRHIRCVSEVV